MSAPRSRIQLERRRSAAIAGGVLLALLLVGLIIALTSGDDGDDTGGAGAAAEPADTSLPTTAGTISNQRIGATIRKPAGWSARRDRAAIVLRSRDSSTVLSVSLPPQARRSAGVLRAAVRGLRRQYRGAEVGQAPGRRLGNLPAVAATVTGRNSRGTPLRVLVAAPQGRKRAWLVQVFAGPDRTGGRRLAEAQTALGTLRLRG